MRKDVIQSLDKRGRESKKFVFGVVAMLLNTILFALALYVAMVIYAGKPEALDWFGFGGFLAMSLGSLNMLPLGYVGSTSWQEHGVKIAALAKDDKE